MASVPMATGLLCLVCAAWTLLSDLAVVAYSPMIRLVSLACAFITTVLIITSIRRESPGPGAGSTSWNSRSGRLGVWLAMVALVLMTAHILSVHRVNLDAVSHAGGVAIGILLFSWAVLRRRSRPTT